MRSPACPKHWSIQQRLDRSTIRDPKTGCILWTGCRNPNGYGKLAIAGRLWLAHRASWTAARGPIPAGLVVCHKCDVRTCINPKHLFLGTQADNMADRVAKLRRTTAPVPEARWRPEKSPEIMRIEMLGREFVTRVLAIRPLTTGDMKAGTVAPASRKRREARVRPSSLRRIERPRPPSRKVPIAV